MEVSIVAGLLSLLPPLNVNVDMAPFSLMAGARIVASAALMQFLARLSSVIDVFASNTSAQAVMPVLSRFPNMLLLEAFKIDNALLPERTCHLMLGGSLQYLRALGKEGSNNLGLMRLQLPTEIGLCHVSGHSHHLLVTEHEL
jgi:hypothetical protein